MLTAALKPITCTKPRPSGTSDASCQKALLSLMLTPLCPYSVISCLPFPLLPFHGPAFSSVCVLCCAVLADVAVVQGSSEAGSPRPSPTWLRNRSVPRQIARIAVPVKDHPRNPHLHRQWSESQSWNPKPPVTLSEARKHVAVAC